uniref:uncharacterized protein C20orf202 homolog isoform X2 n=1 Tax=Halichoerus grypus TaxID=9711 RepID=UPI001659AB3F|nr:uncharacterized protein C20orf202 homolog isoform X2 [Halichoerus grypus]
MSLQFFWPLSEGGKMITVAPGITSTFQAKGRRRKLEFRGSFIDIFPFIRKVSVNFPSKDAAMKTEEPTPSLGQTLEWLRKELARLFYPRSHGIYMTPKGHLSSAKRLHLTVREGSVLDSDFMQQKEQIG